MRRTYLIEIDYQDKDTAETSTLRFDAGRGYMSQPGDTPANVYYEPRAVAALNVEQHVYSDLATGGVSEAGFGELRFANPDGALDYLDGQGFDGRPVRVLTGDAEGPLAGFVNQFVGTVLNVEFTWGEMVCRLRDRTAELDVPLQIERFAGTNVGPEGVEGTSSGLKGLVKPLTFGGCHNIPLPCVNGPKRIFQITSRFTSGYQNIDRVYVNGVDIYGQGVIAWPPVAPRWGVGSGWSYEEVGDWTSDGWAGWRHTPGSTESLSYALDLIEGDLWQIEIIAQIWYAGTLTLRWGGNPATDKVLTPTLKVSKSLFVSGATPGVGLEIIPSSDCDAVLTWVWLTREDRSRADVADLAAAPANPYGWDYCWDGVTGNATYIRVQSAPPEGVTADISYYISAQTTLNALIRAGGLDPDDFVYLPSDFYNDGIPPPSLWIGYFVPAAETSPSLLDALSEALGSLRGWCCPDRDGTFRIGQLAVPGPEDEPVAIFRIEDIYSIERITLRQGSLPAGRIVVRYDRNWAGPQATQEQDGAYVSSQPGWAKIADARKEFLAQEYRTVELDQPDTRALHPLAPTLTFTTLLTDDQDHPIGTNAQAEAEALAAIHGPGRMALRMTAPAELCRAVSLGSIVELRIARWSMAAGRKFMVLGLAEELLSGANASTLTLFG